MKTIELLRDGLCFVALVPSIFVLGFMVDLVSTGLNDELKQRAQK
jgi:hypothetical protein